MQADINLFLEVKEVGEDGTFSGIASVYDVEDLGGDVIEKGAFTKTISEHPVIPILWQHDSKEVIGQGEVKETGNKVTIAGKFDLEDPTAQKAYRKLKNKLIKGLSIGFQAIKSTWQEIEENGASRWIRHIQELKLWEVSVVTFSMLPQAQVTSVKSAEYEARISSLEDKIRALQTTKGTPATEPPKPVEPPPAVPTEPAVDHSLVESIFKSIKGE